MKPTDSNQFFELLESSGILITKEYREKIQSKFDDVLNYEPRVGVFGKTGAGKSSLCNALFGRDICEVSDIAACTRSPQEVVLGMGSRGMTLLDVPGVGESGERDKEYAALYRSLLPTLDLILWVIKGDDRAFSSDEMFYNKIVSPYIKDGTPFFIVLNQVDKIEPFREWNEEIHMPGPNQAKSIGEKKHAVAGFFKLPISQVIPVSAEERFGLLELVDSVTHALPREKRISILREVKSEHRSENAKEFAERGVVEVVVDTLVDLLPDQIPKKVKEVLKTKAKAAVNWVIEKIKFW
jgi:small GTP-binding protein